MESIFSVTDAIGSEFMLEDLLHKIMNYAMTVTGAERGFLLLYEDDKGLEMKVARGPEGAIEKADFSYDRCRVSLELVQQVERSHMAVITGEEDSAKLLADLKNYSIKQAMCLPLQIRDKSLGILYLDNTLAGGMFGAEELDLMKSFAVQASVSIENVWLVQNLVEQERLKQEMAMGRKIQEALLPQTMPEITGARAFGLLDTAQEINGDYFDFIPYSKDKLGIVVADVSGKGLDAGMTMAMTKAAICSLAEIGLPPKEMLLRLNELLCEQFEQKKSVALMYAEYTSDGRFTWSGAGHEALILRASDNRVETIRTGGIGLGMEQDVSPFLVEQTITLQPGDKVALYTNGVAEACNASGQPFTAQRIARYIRENAARASMKEVLTGLKDEVNAHTRETAQRNDIVLAGLEVEARK